MNTSVVEIADYQVDEKVRLMTRGTEPAVLGDIYHEEINLAVWQRDHSSEFKEGVQSFLLEHPTFKAQMTVTPETIASSLKRVFERTNGTAELEEDISELVDMYCYLFELKQAGLRLSVLDRAMCPRFHIDRVPCRLVTTYVGSATEWIAHEHVDRSKLGAGNKGKPDNETGIYREEKHISQLSEGDVALLKGETWENNEGAGLVHRSPAVIEGELRLLLTLDFI